MFNRMDLPTRSFSISQDHLLVSATHLVLAVYLMLFQSGVMSYVGMNLPAVSRLLSPLFYLLYAVAALLLVRLTLTRYWMKDRSAAVWLFFLLATAPLLFVQAHAGGITKNYIVGLGSLAMFTTIGSFSDPRRICRFAASLTALLSVLCLIDASFPDGFTNTLGRAATLLTNPNIAALALLIGATGTIWSLAPRWRVPFIVLVGGAVFATLSRSSMFIGALVCLSSIPLLKPVWHRRAAYVKSTLRPTLIALLLTLSLLIAGFVNNSSFGLATGNAFEGLRFAVKTLQDVKSKQAHRGAQSEKLNAITENMVSEAERENSASARAILLQRAWQSYRHGPAFGQGLEKAFSLAPHNTQLLLMVAFGYFGWVIVPMLIALIFRIGGWRRGLPSAVVVAGGAFFSHDLLLAIPLIASLVVLLIGLRVDPDAAPQAQAQAQSKAGGRAPFAIPVILIALASLVALYAQSQSLQSYRFDVPAKDVKGLEGPLYYVVLPDALPKGLVRLNAVKQEMQLTESSRPLDYSTEFGGDQQDLLLGFGQYSVRNMWLWFVPGDGSDPELNGRTYRFSGQVIINPEFEFMILAVLLWAAIWVFLDRRNDVRK
jgi:hypothetical protein